MVRQTDYDDWQHRRQRPTAESMWCKPVTNDQQRAHIGLRGFVRTRITRHYATVETGQNGP
jgi:hypothetical protein